MTYKEAAGLKVGDRVMWKNNPADLGTVTEVEARAARVEWDEGARAWFRFELAEDISRAPEGDRVSE